MSQRPQKDWSLVAGYATGRPVLPWQIFLNMDNEVTDEAHRLAWYDAQFSARLR